jgi:large subunit ribosomal protein L23
MRSPQTILKGLQITEKGTRLTEAENKYFFKVDRTANKPEIRSAIEKVFKVGVVKVHTMNYLGKEKRERYRSGRKASWKRAIVTLKKGDKIDLE